MRQLRWMLVAAAALAVPQMSSAVAQPAPATAPNAEDARLTAFLDKEFAEDLKLRPQLATRLGEKVGEDRLDDISDAAELLRLEARRAAHDDGEWVRVAASAYAAKHSANSSEAA